MAFRLNTNRMTVVLALIAFVVAGLGIGVASASAASAGPALSIRPVVKPTHLGLGGSGTIVDLVTNVGAVATDAEPVTIIDTLPVGLTATSVKFRLSPGESNAGPCETTGRTVTCTYGEALPGSNVAGLEMLIAVSAEPGKSGALVNGARVTGGGSAPTSTSNTIVIEAAEAGFGLDGPLEADAFDASGALDTQAGDHPSLYSTTFVLNSVPTHFGHPGFVFPAQEAKDISVLLPVGFVGDPLAAPACPEHLVAPPNDGKECPAASVIGTVAVQTYQSKWSVSAERGDPIAGPVFNVVPEAGHPAELGFIFQTQEVLLYASLVHTPAGYAVRITSANILPFAKLTGIKISLFGNPSAADGGTTPQIPFFTNPSDCDGGPQVTQMQFDSWQNPANLPFNPDGSPDVAAANFEGPGWQQAAAESPAVTGCEKLTFTPELKAPPTSKQAGEPTGVEAELKVPQNSDPNGLATPDLKDATVTLPQGVVLNPSQANGLQACSDAQFAQDSTEPASCPLASQVATVTAHTPVLANQLHGEVFIGAPECNPCSNADAQSGRLARLFMQVHSEEYGVTAKFVGNVSIDPSSGQLTATFKNLIQQPIDEVTLNFHGGPRAALANPTACGSYSSNIDLEPWSAPYTRDAVLTSPFDVTENCGPRGFAPSFSAGPVNPQAGAYSPFTLTFSRNDGEQFANDIEQTLPPGLLAKLAGVPRCGEAEASAGACPAGSRIGSVTVGAGPGSDPYYTSGSIYLTGPYNGGPFGEVVVVQAVAGPFNLGTVVVHGSIRVNPYTAQATVVSDPFPSILDGIPLQIRTVNVTLDRPEFTFNPTSCAPSAVTGKLASTQGATATVSSPYEATNCANLGFKPAVSVSTQGKASKQGGASLTVKILPVAGQANTAKFDLELPKQLPARLTTLQKACTEAQFNANPAGCPAASDIGTAKVATPVLGSPLEGPIYLVSHGGAAFPDTEVILQGEGVTVILDGKTQIKKGVTYSHFETVPDAPITSFEAILPEGKFSIFGANLPASTKYDFCGQSLSVPTTITGQNGVVVKQTNKASVTGCPKLKKAKAARKRPGKASKSTRRGK